MYKTSVIYTRILTVLSFILFPFIYLIISLKKRRNVENPKIFMVPQLTRVGDIVCVTPVFQAIKEKYPKSKLVVLSSLKASGIIKNNPRIDEIINIEDYKGSFWKLILKIINENFDFGVSLSGTPLSSVLFFFGFIPTRVKLTRKNRPFSEFFTDWMSNFKYNYEVLTYLPVFYLRMLESLGVNKKEAKKEVFWNKESDNRIDSLFRENNLSDQDKIVGISLSAGNKIKEWGDEKFVTISREIVSGYGMKVVFTGGPSDRDRVDKVISLLGGGHNFINSAGVSLEDLPALMNRFKVFISVDTGPTHIAEALGVPLIDILGPVNDIELTPRGQFSRIMKPKDIDPTVFAFWENVDPEQTRGSLVAIKPEEVLRVFNLLVKDIPIK
ncbi:MAG TPA: glycosyltransferase family 9 protein [Candidatus Paceibacterota bacterium]